jgi:hypothetical protein
MNTKSISSRHNWLLTIPFIAGFMDLVENCFHLGFISDVSSITQTKITLSALASNTKWALAGISLLIALIIFATHRTTLKKGRD